MDGGGFVCMHMTYHVCMGVVWENFLRTMLRLCMYNTVLSILKVTPGDLFCLVPVLTYQTFYLS